MNHALSSAKGFESFVTLYMCHNAHVLSTHNAPTSPLSVLFTPHRSRFTKLGVGKAGPGARRRRA
jgi:hypothetical protein